MNTERRQQPISDKCANKTDEQIADQSKATARQYVTGHPSGDNPNQNNNQQTLIGQAHGDVLLVEKLLAQCFWIEFVPCCPSGDIREVNEGQLMHLERMSPDLINSQN